MARGSNEDALADANMDLVLALFERGFNEDQVQDALKQCRTLAQALALLDPKSAAAVEVQASEAAASGSHAAPSRRRGRKGAPASAPVPAAPVPAAPVPAAPVEAAVVEQLPAPAEVVTESAPHEAEVPASVAVPEAQMLPPVRPLQDSETPPKLSLSLVPQSDGQQWWAEAAKRWPKILAKLRLKAASHIARPGFEDNEFFSDAAMCLETPGKKRPAPPTAEEDCPPGRRSRKDSRGGLVSGTRPPPTPCWATPPHQTSGADRQSPPPPSTPGSSPPPMKLNGNADVCKICFCDTEAWRSVRLGCGHGWYCASCMLRHAEARLDMGSTNICCPECSTNLPERDLRKLLPTEIIDRMLARSLEQAVSSAADLWACPTPNCPMRVALEDGELARLRCTLCKKDSCLKCGHQPYHRGVTCEENAERLKAKSKAHKSAIQAEESLMQWMQETGTKQCPTCRMGVTKQNIANQNTQYSECHKMVCRNCNTRFCFKCLSVLSEAFTCGCTIDAHGFIDPLTGKRLEHLRARKGRPPAAKAAPQQKGKAR